MVDAWGGSWATSWAASWTRGAPPPPAAGIDGPHGPGFHLFGRDAHPTWKRKREADTLEEEIRAALRRTDDAETAPERREAVRELKAVVREAIGKAPMVDDAYLSDLANVLRGVQALQSGAVAYIEDVRRAMELREARENDDLEALSVIMRSM